MCKISAIAVLLATCQVALGNDPSAVPSFNHDVMAVLAKAGCNQGTCHGNQNGKGGFKISLRGQDPAGDWRILTGEMFGRRIDRLEPVASLLLKKPVLDMAHEGGRRFAVDSAEYRVLHDWIAAGAPRDPEDAPKLERIEVAPREAVLVEPAESIQLHATAHFSDGSSRDVTTLAVYEPANQLATVSHDGLARRQQFGEVTVLVRYLNKQLPVRLAFVPARPDFVWSNPPESNYVDELVNAKLRTLRMNPSPPASDAVFLRRAYLDTLGILPTAEEAKSFLADVSPAKRTKLIDDLLERPEFADLWALKWSDLLRNEEKVLDRKGVQNFHAWIRRNMQEGRPLDEFVRDLIAARGSSYTSPQANYYRANRDAVTRSEATAQLFLGTRLQCAKCHNHPFDRWTQDDYYSWAGFFARVDYKILENNRSDKNDKHEFDGEQIVFMAENGEMKNPETDAKLRPKFLGAPTPKFGQDDDRLEALADWVVSPENPLFAKSQANRIWQHLMGRGVVDPIDDFRATNPPANPALLDALARDFVSHGYDLRHLLRTIMNSQTYQRSSEPNETNRDDEINFARTSVRRLTAEQLLDAIGQVTGARARFAGYPEGLRAGEIPGVRAMNPRGGKNAAGDRFLTIFGKPPRLLTCECERSTDTTLGQTVQLISGPTVNDLLTREDNRLATLAAAEKPAEEAIAELYWSALSRAPSPAESAAAAKHLAKSPDRRAALEDIAWALINAKEFLLRQ